MAVTAPFAGETQGAMLNVFDGHGKKGHDCAAYAKRHLPRLTEKYIRQERVKKYREVLKKEGRLKGAKLFEPSMWPYLSPEEYKACCRKAFLDCNKEMQESKVVSDITLLRFRYYDFVLFALTISHHPTGGRRIEWHHGHFRQLSRQHDQCVQRWRQSRHSRTSCKGYKFW